MRTRATKFDRRTIIKGAIATGALQITSPFLIQARGIDPCGLALSIR